jgi:hypothetical protein
MGADGLDQLLVMRRQRRFRGVEPMRGRDHQAQRAVFGNGLQAEGNDRQVAGRGPRDFPLHETGGFRRRGIDQHDEAAGANRVLNRQGPVRPGRNVAGRIPDANAVFLELAAKALGHRAVIFFVTDKNVSRHNPNP